MNEHKTFPKPQRRKKTRAKLRATIPESAIQKQCEDYLDLLNLTYIRLPSSIMGAVFGPHSSMSIQMKQFMSSIVKGVADLTILHPTGTYLCVELKTISGKLSPAQVAWGKPLGDYYNVVRSFEDFRSLVDAWRASVETSTTTNAPLADSASTEEPQQEQNPPRSSGW